MTVISSLGPRDMLALDEELQAAQEKIADLEDKLAHATEVQQAGTVLLLAALVNRLGGEVVLSNTEMGDISGELQSYETFGGRIFRLIRTDTNADGPSTEVRDS